jgi:hypothetical protein
MGEWVYGIESVDDVSKDYGGGWDEIQKEKEVKADETECIDIFIYGAGRGQFGIDESSDQFARVFSGRNSSIAYRYDHRSRLRFGYGGYFYLACSRQGVFTEIEWIVDRGHVGG